MQQLFEEFLSVALEKGLQAVPIDLPIGAVIFDHSGDALASAKNEVELQNDETAHAEMLVVRLLLANHLNIDRSGLVLAVTLEPCPMCAWAIRQTGIGTVLFGAYNTKFGAAGSRFDLLRDPMSSKSPVQVYGGIKEAECSDVLSNSFREIRDNKRW